MAVAVLRRHRPRIVGITGSMGKTTAKDALVEILSAQYPGRVRGNFKNFNNELGLPLTIIGVRNAPGKNPWRYFLLILRFCWTMVFPRYPKILVLEMGIDRKGDMNYLTSFIRPDVAVVTAVSAVHSQYLGDVRQIAVEKGKLVAALEDGGTAVLNFDDPRVVKMSSRTKAKIIGYSLKGANCRADVCASDIRLSLHEGISLKINYRGRSVPLRLPHVVAEQLLGSILAATSAALTQGMNLVEITAALRDFTPAPGRMRVLPGKCKATIIDDTYNAPAAAVKEALRTLKSLKAHRKVVILGDILELGKEEEKIHRSLAGEVIEVSPAAVVTVGRRMRFLHEELLKKGFERKNSLHCDDPAQAGEIVGKFLAAGDLVLVKGSQGMRMEKTVEKLVDLSSAEIARLLPRQDDSWKRREFRQP